MKEVLVGLTNLLIVGLVVFVAAQLILARSRKRRDAAYRKKVEGMTPRERSHYRIARLIDRQIEASIIEIDGGDNRKEQ
jgi:hypothetical protein